MRFFIIDVGEFTWLIGNFFANRIKQFLKIEIPW